MAFGNGPRISTDGLVLCLDAGNPRSYASGNTSWVDLSGNNNSGSLVNGPTFSSAIGGSIVFDGVNDYINCGNSTTLDLTETFTISMWINPSRSNVNSYILDKDFDKYSIIIGYQSGYVNFYNGSYQPLSSLTQISVSNNTWVNIVYSKNLNSLSNNWAGYKNGNQVFIATTSFTNTTTTGSLYLGTTRPSGLNQVYSGSIAQVQIYNRALSAQEVKNNYDAVKSRYGLT